MRYLRSRQGALVLEIDDAPGPGGLADLAERICSGLDGRIVEKVDAFAESYWDIEIDGKIVTLHFHAYIGTRIYAGDAGGDPIIRRVGSLLADQDTPR